MEFAVFSRIAAILLTPGNLLLWAFVAGVIMLFTRHTRAGQLLLSLTVLAAAMAGEADAP